MGQWFWGAPMKLLLALWLTLSLPFSAYVLCNPAPPPPPPEAVIWHLDDAPRPGQCVLEFNTRLRFVFVSERWVPQSWAATTYPWTPCPSEEQP